MSLEDRKQASTKESVQKKLEQSNDSRIALDGEELRHEAISLMKKFEKDIQDELKKQGLTMDGMDGAIDAKTPARNAYEKLANQLQKEIDTSSYSFFEGQATTIEDLTTRIVNANATVSREFLSFVKKQGEPKLDDLTKDIEDVSQEKQNQKEAMTKVTWQGIEFENKNQAIAAKKRMDNTIAITITHCKSTKQFPSASQPFNVNYKAGTDALVDFDTSGDFDEGWMDMGLMTQADLQKNLPNIDHTKLFDLLNTKNLVSLSGTNNSSQVVSYLNQQRALKYKAETVDKPTEKGRIPGLDIVFDTEAHKNEANAFIQTLLKKAETYGTPGSDEPFNRSLTRLVDGSILEFDSKDKGIDENILTDKDIPENLKQYFDHWGMGRGWEQCGALTDFLNTERKKTYKETVRTEVGASIENTDLTVIDTEASYTQATTTIASLFSSIQKTITDNSGVDLGIFDLNNIDGTDRIDGLDEKEKTIIRLQMDEINRLLMLSSEYANSLTDPDKTTKTDELSLLSQSYQKLTSGITDHNEQLGKTTSIEDLKLQTQLHLASIRSPSQIPDLFTFIDQQHQLLDANDYRLGENTAKYKEYTTYLHQQAFAKLQQVFGPIPDTGPLDEATQKKTEAFKQNALGLIIIMTGRKNEKTMSIMEGVMAPGLTVLTTGMYPLIKSILENRTEGIDDEFRDSETTKTIFDQLLRMPGGVFDAVEKKLTDPEYLDQPKNTIQRVLGSFDEKYIDSDLGEIDVNETMKREILSDLGFGDLYGIGDISYEALTEVQKVKISALDRFLTLYPEAELTDGTPLPPHDQPAYEILADIITQTGEKLYQQSIDDTAWHEDDALGLTGTNKAIYDLYSDINENNWLAADFKDGWEDNAKKGVIMGGGIAIGIATTVLTAGKAGLFWASVLAGASGTAYSAATMGLAFESIGEGSAHIGSELLLNVALGGLSMGVLNRIMPPGLLTSIREFQRGGGTRQLMRELAKTITATAKGLGITTADSLGGLALEFERQNLFDNQMHFDTMWAQGGFTLGLSLISGMNDPSKKVKMAKKVKQKVDSDQSILPKEKLQLKAMVDRATWQEGQKIIMITKDGKELTGNLYFGKSKIDGSVTPMISYDTPTTTQKGETKMRNRKQPIDINKAYQDDGTFKISDVDEKDYGIGKTKAIDKSAAASQTAGTEGGTGAVAEGGATAKEGGESATKKATGAEQGTPDAKQDHTAAQKEYEEAKKQHEKAQEEYNEIEKNNADIEEQNKAIEQKNREIEESNKKKVENHKKEMKEFDEIQTITEQVDYVLTGKKPDKEEYQNTMNNAIMARINKKSLSNSQTKYLEIYDLYQKNEINMGNGKFQYGHKFDLGNGKVVNLSQPINSDSDFINHAQARNQINTVQKRHGKLSANKLYDYALAKKNTYKFINQQGKVEKIELSEGLYNHLKSKPLPYTNDKRLLNEWADKIGKYKNNLDKTSQDMITHQSNSFFHPSGIAIDDNPIQFEGIEFESPPTKPIDPTLEDLKDLKKKTPQKEKPVFDKTEPIYIPPKEIAIIPKTPEEAAITIKNDILYGRFNRIEPGYNAAFEKIYKVPHMQDYFFKDGLTFPVNERKIMPGSPEEIQAQAMFDQCLRNRSVDDVNFWVSGVASWTGGGDTPANRALAEKRRDEYIRWLQEVKHVPKDNIITDGTMVAKEEGGVVPKNYQGVMLGCTRKDSKIRPIAHKNGLIGNEQQDGYVPK